jgi:hypothetical protein
MILPLICGLVGLEDSGTLQQDVVAIEIAHGTARQTTLPAGTSYTVEIGRFEWLGREGAYSEISLPAQPDRRFRVRHDRLLQASGVRAKNGR